jgi:hypothetical protein
VRRGIRLSLVCLCMKRVSHAVKQNPLPARISVGLIILLPQPLVVRQGVLDRLGRQDLSSLGVDLGDLDGSRVETRIGLV